MSKELDRRLAAARHFPANTTAASRHLELMADALGKGEVYHMFTEEPRYCADTMKAVLVELYELKSPTSHR